MYFFCFYTEEKRAEVLTKFLKVPRVSKSVVANRREEFQRQKYTKLWKKGKLSNFHYLMLINTYSGRTWNDIS